MNGFFGRLDGHRGSVLALVFALVLAAVVAAPMPVCADDVQGLLPSDSGAAAPGGTGAALLAEGGTAPGDAGAAALDGVSSPDGGGAASGGVSNPFRDDVATLGEDAGDAAGDAATSDDATVLGGSEDAASDADASKAPTSPDPTSQLDASKEDEDGSRRLQAMADVVEQGTIGPCSWSLDTDGLLRFWVTDGGKGQMDYRNPYPWVSTYSLQQKVKKVSIEKGVVLPASSYRLFVDCERLTEVKAADWAEATSNLQNMREMFKGCHWLKTIDVSSWNTSKVTNMRETFCNCLDLAKLDVSRWNTANVTTMYGMFSGCESLGSINVSRWNTSKVTTMEYMFFFCKSLKSLTTHYTDAQGNRKWWDTSKVTSMGAMFASCTSLGGLNASRWNTSNVKNVYSMFAWCESLDTVDLWSWDTSKATDLVIMFDECKSIKTFIAGSKFDVSKAFPYGSYDVTNTTQETIQGKKRTVTRHYSWWFSKVSGSTFAREDIMKKRKGIGDTYTCLNRRPFAISSVSGISNQTFKGAPIKLVPTVKYKGATLKQGTDYTLKYESCDKPGTAKLTITGKGSYIGTIVKTYKLTWPGATRVPVSATADYPVARGYWLRIRRGDGSFASDDGTIKISSAGNEKARVTALRPGTSTICLTDGKGRVICSKNVTVYGIEGRDYELQSVLSKNLVLDIRRRSKANGKEMIVWTRNNQTNQRYRFERQSDGSYAIKCKHSGKYVDVKYGGTKKSQPVIQWSWKGGTNQRWKISVNPDNSVTFTCKKSGMCFDVKGGKVQKGAAMIQYPFKNGSNQKWVLNAK